MQRKSPIKSFKLTNLVSGQVSSGNFSDIYSNTQTRPRHLTSILTKSTHPHKTDIKAQASATHAVHNTRALRKLHQGHKNSGICKQNPYVLQPCPCCANHIIYIKSLTKPKSDSNANVAISILVAGVALLLSLISNLFKKIKFTQLQKTVCKRRHHRMY